MRKIFNFLLACLFLFALTSCNNENTNTQPEPEVQKEWYDLIVFEGAEIDYDGEYHSLEAENIPEGAKASYKNNKNKFPGTYEVSLTVYHEKVSKQYTATLVINKLTPVLTAETTQKVSMFGGNLFPTYEVNYDDVNVISKITQDGVEKTKADLVNPGDYVVEIYTEETNIYKESEHIFVNFSVVESVTGLKFTSEEYTYDGQEKSITVTGNVPTGYTVEYKDNAKTDAGTYFSEAYVKDASGNLVETLRAVLEINYPENAEFATYLDEFFVMYLEGDQLSVNIFCENPADFGLEHYEASWYTYESYEEGYVEEALEDFNELLVELKEFENAQLSDLQQVAYRNIEGFLEYYISYYSIEDVIYMNLVYVDQFGGYVADFGTYMEAYSLRSEEEVKDIVSYILSTETAFPSYLQYVSDRADAGYALSDYTIDEMRGYLKDVIKQGSDYYLADILEAKINKVTFLTDAEKADYIAQVENAITNSFIPGVTALYDGLEQYKGRLTTAEGYWAVYEGGKDLYLLELEDLLGLNFFGINKYITEVDKALKDTNKTVTSTQSKIVSKHGISTYAELEELIASYPIYEGTPEEMIVWLEEFAKNIVPELESDPNIVIKEMDDASAKVSNAVAYYMKSALDNTGSEYITLNPTKLTNQSDTLTTLAHEGYPGHLYAYVYSKELGLSNLSTVMTSTAHGEGWATYVVLALYEYAIANSTDADFIEIMEYLYANELSSYLLEVRLDLGIHYQGWTVKDVANLMSSLGYSSSSAESIYRLIIETPVTYNAYGYGKLMFYNLHQEAKKVLGVHYDEVEFNAMLLSKGWTNLGELENTYNEYMAKKCHIYGIEFK